MRYRERSSYADFKEHVTNVDTESDKTTITVFNSSGPVRVESIRDIVGRRQSENACDHKNLRFSPRTFNVTYVVNQNHWDEGNHTYTRSGRRTMTDSTTIMNLIGNNAGSYSHSYIQQGIESIMPSMASGFTITNFVYELGEVSSLVKWFDKSKSVFRNASQDTLNYNFGLKPFISDLKSAHEGLKSLDHRLRQFISQAGVPQRRHVKFQVTNNVSSVTTTESGYVNPQLYITHSLTGTVENVHVITYNYRYTIPDLTYQQLRTRALLDTIGAYLGAYEVWQAIPYSFVIDWFWDVGKYLKQFRDPWIVPTVKFSPSTYSISTKAQISENRDIYGNKINFGSWKFTHYRRKVFVPVDGHFSLASENLAGSFTLRKFLLGGLLLEQRISR